MFHGLVGWLVLLAATGPTYHAGLPTQEKTSIIFVFLKTPCFLGSKPPPVGKANRESGKPRGKRGTVSSHARMHQAFSANPVKRAAHFCLTGFPPFVKSTHLKPRQACPWRYKSKCTLMSVQYILYALSFCFLFFVFCFLINRKRIKNGLFEKSFLP